MQGLRALLSKYGILICDEVMWMGSNGKLLVLSTVPDIVTMAKGLTSSYIPLGAMALGALRPTFSNVFWGGLTYNAHALA